MGSLADLHILVVPYPTQGHHSPMVQFIERLLSKQLMVTFVMTKANREGMLKEKDVLGEEVLGELQHWCDIFALDMAPP